MMMEQRQRVQIGERLFLLCLFAVIAIEALYTILTGTMWFSWPSVLLGLVGFLLAIYLGNRIYGGDSQALTLLRAWTGFVLLLLAIGLVMKLAGLEIALPTFVGVNVVWLTCLKMAVYGALAALLFSPGDFADYLASKRGQTIERAAPTGSPLELAAETSQVWGATASLMRAGGLTLLIAAGLRLLLGLQSTGQESNQSLLDFVDAALLGCLGAVVFTAGRSVRLFMDLADRNTGNLAQVIGRLATYFQAQMVLGLIAVIILACRLAFFLF